MVVITKIYARLTTGSSTLALECHKTFMQPHTSMRFMCANHAHVAWYAHARPLTCAFERIRTCEWKYSRRCDWDTIGMMCAVKSSSFFTVNFPLVFTSNICENVCVYHEHTTCKISEATIQSNNKLTQTIDFRMNEFIIRLQKCNRVASAKYHSFSCSIGLGTIIMLLLMMMIVTASWPWW